MAVDDDGYHILFRDLAPAQRADDLIRMMEHEALVQADKEYIPWSKVTRHVVFFDPNIMVWWSYAG